MAGALSRRNLFKIGGGAAAAGVGASLAAPARAQEATWQSELVTIGADGMLNYHLEKVSEKKIPNFSWAGYRNGERLIPDVREVPARPTDVPIVKKIGPVSGDNTAHLQAALDEVGAMPMQENGFRGALLLKPGVYEVAETVYMERSGVVLRGSSRSADPSVGTIIRSTATAGVDTKGGVECPLWIGGKAGGWEADVIDPVTGAPVPVKDTATDVTSEVVQAGSRRLALASVADFKVGDNIIIWHPCTQEWIDKIGGGGGVPWSPGDEPIAYNRYIKAIDAAKNEILICAPVFNDLERAVAQSYVYVWNRVGLVRNVGVENLRVDMVHQGLEDEDHADSCIAVIRTEDAWVRDVSTLHFKHAGVIVRRSTRVTVENVTAHHPRSRIVGRMRYSFNAGHMAQLVLFKDLETSEARHAFVSGGQATSSGNVWTHCVARDGWAESGGHAHWSQGLLYDNVKELYNQGEHDWVLSLHNRATGGMNQDQGWSSVYSVLWNCTVSSGSTACVQRPPTSQNFAIGMNGTVNGVNQFPGNPTGYISPKSGPGLEPASLYRAQLENRVGISIDF
ncbi:hypothetical protein [Glycomyces niveus]|uniref:Peptidoglycan-binding protein n=1 Tax=Glycomyces niveus TaxID=2820287 RepID=A0ABS3UAC5_9ACTN|nr:hypothetical protein [Glycomyces sp. NEAU-S30]MBO3734703.1 hypothetical protein [Glycomyces sp. NEAU-S30]